MPATCEPFRQAGRVGMPRLGRKVQPFAPPWTQLDQFDQLEPLPVLKGAWSSWAAHVSGRVMIADLLTKAVARVTFHTLLDLFDRYPTDGVVCPAK